MRLIIAGSRTVFPSNETIDAAFDDFAISRGDVSEVVSGGASGADYAGEIWAGANDLPVATFLPDYDKYDKYHAPKRRNRAMAEYAWAALVFWDGMSGGSADMIARMVVRHKTVFVIPSHRVPIREQPRRPKLG